MSGNTKEMGANEGYNIEVTGRHVAVTDAMKDYAIEKVGKIERFTNRIIDVHVTMDIQKLDHKVSIVMKVGHWRVKVQAVSPDMYASIDKAADRLSAKLRRYQDRLQEHRATPIAVVDMNVNVYQAPGADEVELVNDDIEDENRRQLEAQYQPNKVDKVEKRPLKTLTLDEAIFKMEISDDFFMLYRSEEDPSKKLRVIYRRGDGNYGVLEPE